MHRLAILRESGERGGAGPRWRGGEPTTLIGETFRALFPAQAERLFGSVEIQLQISDAYSPRLLELRQIGLAPAQLGR